MGGRQASRSFYAGRAGEQGHDRGWDPHLRDAELHLATIVYSTGRVVVRGWLRDPWSRRRSGRALAIPPRLLNPRPTPHMTPKTPPTNMEECA